MTTTAEVFSSIEEVTDKFATRGYLTDRLLATTVYLAVSLRKPIFVEGEPGVGKTELAKVLADVLDTELIRLQCYEGLDTNTALYEWNYPRQMLEVRLEEARGVPGKEIGANIFAEEFLLKRPLLRAIQAHDGRPPVLLIDEIDRSDEEFEAFLLEVLSDFQITIPEIGTIKATEPPLVVLTSNRTRELHDALKRRCVYHWIDYPDFGKEVDIITTKVPGIQSELTNQVAAFMQLLRDQDLYKRPGIAETIDWGCALMSLGIEDLDPATISSTVGCILKYKGDVDKLFDLDLEGLLKQVKDTADTAQLAAAASA